MVSTPNTILTLAWASRDCVFTSTTGTSGSATTTCEGTDWYYNDNYSWGFAKAGDGVNIGSCDIATNGCDNCRLCWHTLHAGSITGGYRCGSVKGLNADTNYERVIFQSGVIKTFIFY